MLNFTVGPVQSSDEVLAIGGQQVPYFRTPEFSQIMLESEHIMLDLVKAPENSRVAFMTGSGTASMEASIMDVLRPDDRAIVVDGGSFGHRFNQMLDLHGIEHDALVPEPNMGLSEADLAPFEGKGYTAFLVNLHETSKGVLYNLNLISDFCKRNGLVLIVDAISAFLADPIDMAAAGADVVITGSQKALACPPGISICVLSPRAIERIESHEPICLYLSLREALKNGERGQTPWTPAVGTLLQINARLKTIQAAGGAEAEIARVAALAADFRSKLADLPFELVSKSPSNAVTPLHPTTAPATRVFQVLKDEYGIWVCPNGGDLADVLFRVGHIGALTPADNDTLIAAFKDLQKRGII